MGHTIQKRVIFTGENWRKVRLRAVVFNEFGILKTTYDLVRNYQYIQYEEKDYGSKIMTI